MPYGPRRVFLFSLFCYWTRLFKERMVDANHKSSSGLLTATFVFFTLATPHSLFAAEGDPQRGREKSITCVACHGQNGISPAPMWPNLAGQKEQYFILQMQAYKSGERRNELMSPIVVPLTEQDIRDLAAYYAQLKP